MIAVASALWGCSVLDNVVKLPRCESDADCAGVVSSDPQCLTVRCESQRCVERVVDRDDDGFAGADCASRYCEDEQEECRAPDCDDLDPTVHPDAPELCNGIDDDCNGVLDGPDEDDDGDGHADRCAGRLGSDCDDEDPNTYVGAPERCDGLDNDCFVGGLVRSSGGEVPDPSEDRDGDGHSSPNASCLSDGERDFPKDDCDDESPLIFAGAAELCDNLDNNCNRLPDDHIAGAPGSSCLAVDVSTGDAHSCARMIDGSVVCWGDGDYRLGGTLIPDPELPSIAQVAGAEHYVDISAGQDGTCGVLHDGQIRCWGPAELATPELGERFPRRNGIVNGVESATQVVASLNHACARTADGIACWGRAESGAVDGIMELVPSQAPHVMSETLGATDVDTSITHTCAVIGGRVRCWGDPSAGALGGTPSGSERAVWVDGISNAAEVAVGLHITCVRHDSGSVSCFGDDSYDDVPCRSCPEAMRPRAISGLRDVISIDAYNLHVCAATSEGDVWCWGDNRAGQLGLAVEVRRSETEPIRVANVQGATQVEVGSWHTCALHSQGLQCWGLQSLHRLGDGLRAAGLFRPQAFEASALRRPAQIAATARSTCFRMPDLSLRCAGQLTGVVDDCYALPSPAWGSVIEVAAGPTGICAITATLDVTNDPPLRDRRVRCAGTAAQASYVRGAAPDGVVPFPGNPKQVSVGHRHACMVDDEGMVWCWGSDQNGQVGVPNGPNDECMLRAIAVPCALSPQPVPIAGPARAVAAGLSHTCALLEDSRVQCWGDNALGQLGRSPISPNNGVGFVDGLPTNDRAIGIAVGGDTTCVVLESRQAWCWGETMTRRTTTLTPQWIQELGSVEQVSLTSSADGIGLCARLSTGFIWCLGTNEFGRLGGQLPVCESGCAVVDEPVASQFSDAVDLACGTRHCCATRRSGQVRCWGDRTHGQGADGARNRALTGTQATVDLTVYHDDLAPPSCNEGAI